MAGLASIRSQSTDSGSNVHCVIVKLRELMLMESEQAKRRGLR